MIILIKPTKHNVKAILRRGLYSDDGDWFFDLYEAMWDNKAYKMEEDKYKIELLLKLGITW